MKNSYIKILTWFRKKVDSVCEKIETSILSDKHLKCQVVFGPVYSRRLGYVLGINNLSSKKCSYDCIYCPINNTSCCTISSDRCLSEYELYASVKKKLEEIQRSGRDIEYILFSGSGDPALDSNLSKEILILREFGYKIAVFTSSALLFYESIQENLLFADLVSIKIDTVNEETWHKINRPHQRLRYNLVLNGVEQFARKFKGTLITGTMLVKDLNDNEAEIDSIAAYLNKLPHKASYFMTPMYPPEEIYAVSPDVSKLELLKDIINKKVKNSILLCCPEKEEFFSTSDFENELLGLLSVHPVDVNAVKSFVKRSEELQILNNLILNSRVTKTEYRGKEYLINSTVNV